VVTGLSSDAGKPGSNPVEGSINKSVKKCVRFCPDTPLANESLFQSANERPEPVLLNVYGAPELMPRNEFRQPM
jgi:hypothetical protein